MDMEHDELCSIGEAAVATALSVNAICHCEELGLGWDEIRRLLEITEEVCPSRHPDDRRLLADHLDGVASRVAELMNLQTRHAALLSKDGSEHGQRCPSGGCGCINVTATARLKRGGGEAEAGSNPQRKGQGLGRHEPIDLARPREIAESAPRPYAAGPHGCVDLVSRVQHQHERAPFPRARAHDTNRDPNRPVERLPPAVRHLGTSKAEPLDLFHRAIPKNRITRQTSSSAKTARPRNIQSE
ncbi:MAG: hypothetical protein RIC85_00605 [Gammaproteobacteria bacterium]